MELLKWLSSDGSSANRAGSSIDTYMMLARRARACGLLAEDVQDDDIWCQVLSRSLIDAALHSSSSEVMNAVMLAHLQTFCTFDYLPFACLY